MIDVLAETPPKKGYQEVDGRKPEIIYLRCHCGQLIKRRRDAFIPGMHVVICLACHNISTEIALIDGSVAGQKPNDHHLGDDYKPPQPQEAA